MDALVETWKRRLWLSLYDFIERERERERQMSFEEFKMQESFGRMDFSEVSVGYTNCSC